jgi:muramoyltetrapeptide carboxypeptidase
VLLSLDEDHEALGERASGDGVDHGLMAVVTARPSVIVPPRLQKGDPIAIVAPAGPVPEERFAPGLALLQARYDVRWSPRVFARSGFLAGDDAARRAELEAALTDAQVRAVVCARGGYGVMRYLGDLDPMLLQRQPRALVGFSDITALHAWAARAGVASVHGPVVTQLGELPGDDVAALFDVLEGARPATQSGLASLAAPTVAEGPLYGGNLELVTRLLGTRFAFPLADAVLLLEEIGERPYRLDRALTQLALAGVLEQVAAVVLGDLVRCVEPDGSGPTAVEVVRERLGRLGVPVLAGLPVGHGPRNQALGLGVRVRVDGGAGILEPLEPALA